jgi:hypothetical protein
MSQPLHHIPNHRNKSTDAEATPEVVDGQTPAASEAAFEEEARRARREFEKTVDRLDRKMGTTFDWRRHAKSDIRGHPMGIGDLAAFCQKHGYQYAPPSACTDPSKATSLLDRHVREERSKSTYADSSAISNWVNEVPEESTSTAAQTDVSTNQ